MLVGGVLWFFVLQSGVHATLAGVAVALCVPMGKPEEEARSPLLFLEEKLHMWVAFAVVPIFGFANAGVSLAGISMENLVDPVPLGVALGLLVGKQIGIFLLAALAIRMGLAKLPEGSNWAQLYGVALLCGIGFTMSLFIGNLAFAGSAHLIDEVKEAVPGVLVPADLLETLLITTEQALWGREWAARDGNYPVPESVTHRLADAAKVRALLKN